MKELVKFAGLLISKDYLDCEYFEELCTKYSSSQQLDYMRISVILAFKLCIEKLLTALLGSKLVNGYQLFLRFCRVFLRLLQDEVPEVRQKMSNFLCKRLFKV